jgi:MoaA/NifB/PqqE/SkfB family radical SAM enzyme
VSSRTGAALTSSRPLDVNCSKQGKQMVEDWKWFFMELTNRCSFDCVFCPSGISERPRQDMDGDTAFSLIDQLQALGFDKRLCFHVLGEPLLHPEILNIIDHAAEAGMTPVLFTNGGALTDETVQGVLNSRARELVISMQTINPPSYEALRKTPIGWDAYLSRIQTALAAANESHSGCSFRVSMGIKKKNALHPEELFFTEYESNELIKESIAAIFDQVKGCDLTVVFAELDTGEIENASPTKVTNRLALSVKQMGNWRRIWRDEPTTSGRCRFFGEEMAVLSNGNVTFCHLDYDGRTTIGNINKMPLMDIIGAPAFGQTRQAFLAGEAVAAGCEYCGAIKSI